MRPYGWSFAMRPTGRLLRALVAATRQRRRRGLHRKLRKQLVGPAGRSEAKPAQLALASLSLRAARCWSLTATPSPIDRTTHCRKPFAAATATRLAALSASPISCCGSTRMSALAPLLLDGTAWTPPTKRHEMFPAYQSGRVFDEELIEQLNVLPDFVAAFGFANAKAPGFEADDFLAAAVAAEERAGGSALVASGDRDSFQLASPRTTILYPSRGGELARIGPEEVRQRYGVDPNQVPDFIALRGDPSDKLPGAPGVGPKRGAELLRRYGTLDGVLDAGLFQTQAEMLRLYRLIATMDAKARLPSLADQEPTWASASSLARSWGLNQLANRLDEMA